MTKFLFRPTVLLLLFSALLIPTTGQAIEASKAQSSPIIDGAATESVWEDAPWHKMDKHMLGEFPEQSDFSGQFKVSWDERGLYILAEITDDVLFDQHADPLFKYWDDDCLEIFIDEDMSGGNHQFDFNAFAYHVALDNQAVDMGPNNPDGSTQFILLNDHVESVWKRSKEKPHKLIWEVAVSVYDDSFQYLANRASSSIPLILTENKKMGFMLAYCDNDGSKEREHFLGSQEIAPVNGNKNLGYINASVFGPLLLVK
ncbi:MAG: sugar-binding protein [Pseudomonadales bacterium]